MRQKLFLSLIFALAWLSISAQSPKKFAVIVGCADYQNNRLDLRYPDDDAYRYYAYLKSCDGGGIDDENVAILVDEAATKQNIINTMNSVFSKAGENDMLIFYFSGHGSEGAFCPTDITDQFSSLLSHDEVKSVFKKYPAKYKICFADACFSGSIYQGKPPSSGAAGAANTETSVVIIMSSTPDQTSQENPKIRQGAFTYYLLKGLKGAADRNSDKTVTLEELFPYVKANVLNFTNNQQCPIIEGNASRYMPIGSW